MWCQGQLSLRQCRQCRPSHVSIVSLLLPPNDRLHFFQWLKRSSWNQNCELLQRSPSSVQLGVVPTGIHITCASSLVTSCCSRVLGSKTTQQTRYPGLHWLLMLASCRALPAHQARQVEPAHKIQAQICTKVQLKQVQIVMRAFFNGNGGGQLPNVVLDGCSSY